MTTNPARRPLVASLVALLATACASVNPTAIETDRFGTSVDAIEVSNGLTTNGLVSNALVSNALVSNALVSNALVSNALVSNALVSNALLSNALRPDGLTEGAVSRKVLEYVYQCAMPVGTSMDLVIDGTSYGTYEGKLGLAEAWATGGCDLSCQRWVSACVLARTNFWGIPVPLSVRGNHPALTPTPQETTLYPFEEGTYFGNIFGETMTEYVWRDSAEDTCPGGGGCNADNYFYWSPLDVPFRSASYGPASAYASVTNRLCSTLAGELGKPGDCGISVEGPTNDVCFGGACAPHFDAEVQCEYQCPVSPFSGGEMQCQWDGSVCWDYFANAPVPLEAPPLPVPETITVFIQQPDSCGNGACEVLWETDSTCPADCKPLGAACTATADCGSGFCADGVCCNSACSAGVCDACSVATGATADGTCTPRSGSCDDGNACTEGDTCQSGACVGGSPRQCAGTQCAVGTCHPEVGCYTTPVQDGTTCDDGRACTVGDQCLSGLCLGTSACPSTQCAYGQCGSNGECTVTPRPSTWACNDGNACTSVDRCDGAGSCAGTPKVCAGAQCNVGVCDPATGACGLTPTANGTSCSDGSLCTTGDACNSGVCVGGAAPSCDDDNACTTDSCNAASGCVHQNNTATCDDENTCTTGDTCNGAGVCKGTVSSRKGGCK